MPKRNAQRLTQEVVDAIEAYPDKEGWFPDNRFEGFGVRTRPSGTITYELRWRDGTQQKRHKICRTSEKTLDDVLELLRGEEIAQKIRPIGADVSNRRVADAAEATLADVYQDLMDELLAKGRSDGYINETARLWFQYLRLPLGDELIQDVTREALETFLKDLEDYPSEANQVRAVVTRLFKLAVKLDYRADNPAINLFKFPKPQRGTVLSTDQKAHILEHGGAFVSAEAFERICVLMNTGLRPGDLERMRWDAIDLQSGTWSKPVGRSEDAPVREIPLPSVAVKILTRRRDAGYAEPFSPFSIRRAWVRLKHEFSLPEDAKPYAVEASGDTSAAS